ncbi:helix-turn-helix domain-containing protein [Coleofasciculus sp. FACHB-129]|uniref:helix-turn-helix domain-containing protein n=1 Tax=Cyanophyceae TaxID=3028117 RepID=UPI0016854531|nr:helix-turn-helix domain-containing protein [Coleofasciculus sp. FACHB-129]MBD1893209.1 helix-turn-helix domain-containing protein [Coleofasciculus sp. FACHB-129]
MELREDVPSSRHTYISQLAIDRTGVRPVSTSSYLHFSTGDRTGVREKESKVLELIRQGISYRKVAEELGLSKNTVIRIVRESQQALPNRK